MTIFDGGNTSALCSGFSVGGCLPLELMQSDKRAVEAELSSQHVNRNSPGQLA